MSKSFFNRGVFLIFILVVMLRVFANFNLFNYPFSVILPLVFIPLYLLSVAFFPIKMVNANAVSKELVLSLLILANFIFIPVFQFILFDNLVDELGRRSFEFVGTISLLCVSWFLLGCVMSKVKELTLFYSFLVLVSIFISVYLMFTSFKDGPLVDYYYLTSLRSDNIKIQHLSLTEPLVFLIFLFLSIGFKSKFKWLFLFLSLFLFFSLGGRTAFYCTTFTILIYELIISSTLKYLIKLFFIFLVSSVFFIITNFSDNLFLDKLLFKGGLDSDESYKGRSEFLSEFIDGFLNQFVIGYPNFFIEKHNDLGAYSHNILSVFQFYGFSLFIVVVYTIFYIGKAIIKYKTYKSKNIFDIFGVLMFIYVILSVVTGKAVLFPPLWFVLGFLLFRLKRSTQEQSYVQ